MKKARNAMSKRLGIGAMVAVVAIVVAAAVGAQAGNDPGELACDGGYQAIGFNEPSKESVHESPTEALDSFLADMEKLEGTSIPDDVALVDVTSEAVESGQVFAAQVDGKTIAVLHVEQLAGGWAVVEDQSCG